MADTSVTSEGGVLEFPESIVQLLSSSAHDYIGDFLHHVVEPIFKGILSSYELPSEFQFEKIELGTILPAFKLLSSRTLPQSSCIVSDFEYSYDGNADVKVQLLGIQSGIKDLIIKGRARAVLKPLTKRARPLYVGGVQLMLLDVPQLYFDMDGLIEVCDWPVIRSKLRKELFEAIKKTFVYPNNYSFPLSYGVDPLTYRAFKPTGLLAVRLNFAEGLPVKGSIIRSLVGQDKPDTYAKVILGSLECESKTIKDSTEPSWEDDVIWHEFLVDSLEGHSLRVELFDEDTLTKDEFLGEITIDLQKEGLSQRGLLVLSKNLLNNEFRKTKYDIQGKFTLTLRWLPLGRSEPLEDYEGPTRAILSIFIYSCNNLILEETPEGWASAYAEIEYQGTSRRTPIMKFNPHPSYNFGESFTCQADYASQEAVLHVKDETGFDFGSLKLPLAEYIKNPIHRKILVLTPETPFATATLSVSVQKL